MSWQFYGLNQTHRYWASIYPAYNGDVYAGTQGDGIYIRPDGESVFVELKDSADASYPGNIYGITGTPNGDIYRSRNAFKFMKRTGGVGDFVTYEVNYDYTSMLGMNYSPITGMIYNCHYNGPGVSRFDPTHAADHAHGAAVWYSGHQSFHSCVSKVGDLYITSHQGNGPGASASGYIWKQTGETGAVNVLTEACPEFPDEINGSGYREWAGIAASSAGDVFASDGVRVFRKAQGQDLFYAFQTISFIDMQGSPDGSVYGVVSGGDIYKLDSPASRLKHYAQIIG